MKKVSMIFGFIVLLFSACSNLSPAVPTVTPAPPPLPTPTPDPCSKENILAQVENLQISVNEFKEVEVIANQIDVNSMVAVILRLQEIRFQMMREKVPVCLETFKSATNNYTGSVMNYLLIFINDPNSEDLGTAIESSQTQWQALINEFNNVLAIAGLEAQPVTESGNITPTPTGVAATATNEGSSTASVYANPELNSEVVASLEKGTKAEVIGRTDASDWLQVKLNGITGWVSAELVVINIPIDQLPVVEVIP
jgi:hypothetical protein